MSALHRMATVAVLAALAAPAGAAEQYKTIPVRVKTDKEMAATRTQTDGASLEFEAMDGRAHFALEGRFQFDTLFFDGVYNDAALGDAASDTRTRRIRLGVGGGFEKDWEWLFVIDVNNDTGRATLDTGQITYKGFGWADLNVGRFKRPFLLDAVTSSKWISTVERSLAYDVARSHVSDFAIMLSRLHDVGAEGKLSWYASMLNEGVEDYAAAEDAAGRDRWQMYGRVAWAPWARSADTLHLGAAVGSLNPEEGSTIDILTRLGVSAAEAHTTSYTIDDDNEAGLEALYIRGPFSLQWEGVGRRLDLTAGDSADVVASYLQATWTVTGESRQYKPYPARPDKVVPDGTRTWGALELVARFDRAELDVPGAETAEADVVTVGANWYVNAHLLLKLNYLSAQTENFGTTGDSGNAVTTRIAFQF